MAVYDQPRYKLFAACADDKYHKASVDLVVRPLQAQALECKDCVDASFALPWIRRLADDRPQVASSAQAALKHMLSVLPGCSASCERKHLLGQGRSGGKRRGRAPRPQTLAMDTYAKSVQNASERHRDIVTGKVLGDAAGIVRRFSQSLSSLSLGHTGRRSQHKAGAPLALSRRYQPGARARKVSSYNIFVTEQAKLLPAGLSTKEQRVRVTRLWRELLPDAKGYYEAMAEAKTNEKQKLSSLDFAEFCAQAENCDMPKLARQTLRRRATLESLQRMQQHEAWRGGLGLECYDSGLAKQFVSTATGAAIETEASALFQYDSMVLQNDGPVGNNKACALKFGGLCGNDPLTAKCALATKNLYAIVSGKLGKRNPC